MGTASSEITSAPRFEWLRSVPEVLRLGRDWDGWLREWGVDNTFLRWDWIRPWLRIYGRKTGIMVGLLKAGDTVIGLAPLQLVHEKVSPVGPTLRSVRFAGDGPLCPDHLVLPVVPGQEQTYARLLVAELGARRASWDRIELRDLLETHSAWKEFESAARAAGFAPVSRPRTHCPYLTLPSTWEEYLASLHLHQRKTLRYGFNRLERKLGAVLFEPSSISQVDHLMCRLATLHNEQWEARGRRGVFSNSRFTLFHQIHARRAFRSGRLVLLALKTEEREVGVSLVFRRDRAAEGYQVGHDPKLRELGIGSLLVVSVTKYAIEHGLRELDMLRGAGDYKFRISSEERRGIDLTIGRGTASDLAGRLARGSRRLTGGVFRAVLNRKQINRVKRALRIRS